MRAYRQWADAVTHLDEIIKVERARWTFRVDRGRAYAELAKWDKAADDLSQALRLDPQNQRNAFHLAALLAQLGDIDVYHQHCRTMLSRWGNTGNPLVADRTAKVCLLIPDAVDDPKQVARLVETALAAGEAHWA